MANAANRRLIDLGGKVSRNLDVPLVLAVIVVLLVIIIQMPPMVMDFLLVVNITIGMVILVTTIYVTHPLDFSVFPSMLLVTTFFRLALNIATTRLILGRAGEHQEAAAGGVVEAFGRFVVGDNPIVGAVIFVIIFLVQLMVITKGATRVSEVAARFTLDAMPGKQLSIDADLNAGLIDEQEARQQRDRLTQEADFFGSMDGASKFVRGDAIAGIIITLVNVVGGLLIGLLKYDMTFAEAVDVFTKLTIGDGLVSQVPALVISIAAGLLVTRNASQSDLGKEFFGQLMGNPKAMYITSAFLLILVPSGLPISVLLTGAVITGGIGYALQKIREETTMQAVKESVKEAEKTPAEKARSLISVDALELEVGYGLVNLVDQSHGGNLLGRISMIREQIAVELGFVVPPVRIRDNMQLDANTYVIKLRGVPIGQFQIIPDHYLAMEPGIPGERLDGISTVEPTFNLPAIWIPEAHRAKAESLGYTVVDITSVIATHLTELIRSRSSELLSRDEVNNLIQSIQDKSPALITELIPEVIKLGDLQKVLVKLLEERVSIRDLETIVETLGDYANKTKDPEVLTEYVRHALGRSICQSQLSEDGQLHVVTLDPTLEDYLNQGIERTERGSYLSLTPEMLGVITARAVDQIEKLVIHGHTPVVLCAPQVRLQLRKVLETKVPGLVVLSYNEVDRGISVESHGIIVLEASPSQEAAHAESGEG